MNISRVEVVPGLLTSDSIGSSESYHQAAVVHHRVGDEGEPAAEEISILFTLSTFCSCIYLPWEELRSFYCHV